MSSNTLARTNNLSAAQTTALVGAILAVLAFFGWLVARSHRTS